MDEYEKFFEAWGTHYCQHMSVGGWFEMFYYSESSLLQVMDTADIEANAKLSFFGFLQEYGAVTATTQVKL